MLYLPKEEGGQGLIHLQSRAGAFCLQLLQRLLYGPAEYNWKTAACIILHSMEVLNLSKSLFLMDPCKVDTLKLPAFYRNLFKVWSLFSRQRTETADSLYWLLEERLVHGARLDLASTSCNLLELNILLLNSRTITLGSLLNFAGPNFTEADATAAHLGIRSVRQVTQLLERWRAALTAEELKMVRDWFIWGKSSVPEDLLLYVCLLNWMRSKVSF